MDAEFYSHGKLLLTGEYLVLHGAKALALPVKMGQKLIVKKNQEQNHLQWNSFYDNKLWFCAQFDQSDLKIISTTNTQRALFVQKLLIETKYALGNSLYFSNLTLENYLEFDPEWGLGSSSSLIANIAKWAKINPFELHKNISRGSAYDIACAGATSPIIFQKKLNTHEIIPTQFEPSFSDRLLFVYLGKKQATEASVVSFLNKNISNLSAIEDISAITEELPKCQNFNEFNLLIKKHEQIVASITGLTSIKNQLFSDFHGEIKSLGAWGGDFIMVSLPSSEKKYVNYFREKGFPIQFTLKELKL